MSGLHLQNLGLIGAAFAIGGVIKGATGVGAPLVAVPLLALLYNVQVAVALFVMPNIASNLLQVIQYRACDKVQQFSWRFAISGIAGALAGTVLLAWLPGDVLLLTVACIILAYIAFRLTKPDWRLSMDWAMRLARPLGALAGMFQGAVGISAPVSITFLNSLRMERSQFIVTISLFFLMMGVVQLPAQIWLGIMTLERFVQSCIALIPLTAFMPVGAMIGRRMPAAVFDKTILCLLGALALKLAWDFVV